MLCVHYRIFILRQKNKYTIMDDCQYLKPVKNKNCYISKLNSKKYVIFNDVKIYNFIQLSHEKNNKGYHLNIFLKDEEKDNLDKIDNCIIDTLINNNNKWFNNNLEEKNIINMYKKTYCSQNNILKCIISNNILPEIIINDKKYDNMDELINIINKPSNLKKYYISLKLENIGLYIYKSECYIKLLVKSINIDEIDNDITNELSKKEIEEDWKIIIDEAIMNIDSKISEYEKNKEKILKSYNNLISIDNNGKIWENKILDIKKYINNIIY